MPVDPNEIIRKPDGTGQLATRPSGSGAKKGSFQRLTVRMKEEFAVYAAEHGERANPLVCLAEIMMAEKTDDALRIQAAAKLANFLIPRKFEVEGGVPDEEKIARMQRIRSVLITELQETLHPGAVSIPLIEGPR